MCYEQDVYRSRTRNAYVNEASLPKSNNYKSYGSHRMNLNVYPYASIHKDANGHPSNNNAKPNNKTRQDHRFVNQHESSKQAPAKLATFEPITASNPHRLLICHYW